MKRFLPIGKHKIAASAAALTLSCLLATTTIFAWFAMSKDLFRTGFRPGTLHPTLEISMWGKKENQWIDVRTDAGSAVLNPDFGEMNMVNQLPEDCNAYFKLKVNDSAPAYQYSAIVENVACIVTKDDSFVNKYDYDYYKETYRFLSASFFAGEDIEGTPADLLYSEPAAITQIEQPVNPDGAAQNQTLYIKLEPTGDKLQNLIEDVPIKWMPYYIAVQLTICGELRTVNETNGEVPTT